MRTIDLNFIRFENLLSDETYNYVYNKSKDYIKFLPGSMKLGNCYLVNFVNFSPSETAGRLIPNDYAHLNILVGCREYKNNDVGVKYTPSEYLLYLYFHSINLSKLYSQSVTDEICQSFYKGVYSTGEKYRYYLKSGALTLNYTNIEALKPEFKKLVYDYLEDNKVMSLLKPNSKQMKEIYIDTDEIEVPF